jgi:hypothetical protein
MEGPGCFVVQKEELQAGSIKVNWAKGRML